MKKILIIITINILTFNCFAQKTPELKRLKIDPSHEINNSRLNDVIETYIQKNCNSKSPFNIILLNIFDESNGLYSIYIKASNFEMEKDFYKINKEKFKSFKGYACSGNFLVLLFGNKVNHFTDKNHSPEKIFNEKEFSNTIITLHNSYYYYSYNTRNNSLEFEGIIDKLPR